MNRITKAAVAAAALSLLAGSAFAESNATATGTSHTSVIASIAASQTTPLEFGTIVRPAAAGASGTVTLATNSNTVAAVAPVTALGTTATHAVFHVTGDPGRLFNITGDTTFNLTSTATGAVAIPVSILQPLTSATLDSTSGAYDIPLGGSFTVSGSTTTGTYTGSFAVIVAYQ